MAEMPTAVIKVRVESLGYEEIKQAIETCPISYIPALFIAMVQRSREAWRDRESMLKMAGKAWDKP